MNSNNLPMGFKDATRDAFYFDANEYMKKQLPRECNEKNEQKRGTAKNGLLKPVSPKTSSTSGRTSPSKPPLSAPNFLGVNGKVNEKGKKRDSRDSFTFGHTSDEESDEEDPFWTITSPETDERKKQSAPFSAPPTFRQMDPASVAPIDQITTENFHLGHTSSSHAFRRVPSAPVSSSNSSVDYSHMGSHMRTGLSHHHLGDEDTFGLDPENTVNETPAVKLWREVTHTHIIHRQGLKPPPMVVELSKEKEHGIVRPYFRLFLPQADALQTETVLCCRKKSKGDKYRFSLDPSKMEKKNNPSYVGKMSAKILRSQVTVFTVSLKDDIIVAEIRISSELGKHHVQLKILNQYLNLREKGEAGRVLNGVAQHYMQPLLSLQVKGPTKDRTVLRIRKPSVWPTESLSESLTSLDIISHSDDDSTSLSKPRTNPTPPSSTHTSTLPSTRINSTTTSPLSTPPTNTSPVLTPVTTPKGIIIETITLSPPRSPSSSVFASSSTTSSSSSSSLSLSTASSSFSLSSSSSPSSASSPASPVSSSPSTSPSSSAIITSATSSLTSNSSSYSARVAKNFPLLVDIFAPWTSNSPSPANSPTAKLPSSGSTSASLASSTSSSSSSSNSSSSTSNMSSPSSATTTSSDNKVSTINSNNLTHKYVIEFDYPLTIFLSFCVLCGLEATRLQYKKK